MTKTLYKYWEILKNHPELDNIFVRWGIFFSLLIILSMWIVEPYIDWRQQQYKVIASNHRQVLKLKALKASADKWQQALKNSEGQMGKISNVFVRGESYAIVQQQINTQIKKQIEKYQLVLRTQNLLEVEQTEIANKVSLQFYLSGQMLDIIGFIDTITHQPQVLTIEQLEVMSSRDSAIINITLAAYKK